MKLLLITQVVDRRDTVLGFMHSWIAALAPRFESVSVVCLKKGDLDLPQSVKVLSLGKESGASRLKYLKNLYRYILSERRSYDAVFVHMNQEYVILGAPIWKLLGKKIFMWRNHHAGNWLTRLAIALCDRVFCTSKYSYTARSAKTQLMPVGIDTDKFKIQNLKFKKPNSILFLARIAPVKRPDVLIDALKTLKERGVSFSASIYGDALPKDREYADALRDKASGVATFHPGVPNDATPEIYNAHDVFVNLSSSGMYDKTIFEAMACGALSLSSNRNLEGEIDERLLFREGDAADLADKLAALLSLSDAERENLKAASRSYVEERHSLSSLCDKLSDIINRP